MSLIITCPICGKRNGYEFRYGGEDKGKRPDNEDQSPRSWSSYVHLNTCKAGVQTQWWCHDSGCGTWFKSVRDTKTNQEV